MRVALLVGMVLCPEVPWMAWLLLAVSGAGLLLSLWTFFINMLASRLR